MKQPNAPAIRGVNHITFSVRDLKQSSAFYVDLLGCIVVGRWPRRVYLRAGDLWLALILDEQRKPNAANDYSHVAFAVNDEDFPPIAERIIDAGAPIWQENGSEGESLYFLDPDRHKLEIHAGDLQSRLASGGKSNAAAPKRT